MGQITFEQVARLMDLAAKGAVDDSDFEAFLRRHENPGAEPSASAEGESPGSDGIVVITPDGQRWVIGKGVGKDQTFFEIRDEFQGVMVAFALRMKDGRTGDAADWIGMSSTQFWRVYYRHGYRFAPGYG